MTRFIKPIAHLDNTHNVTYRSPKEPEENDLLAFTDLQHHTNGYRVKQAWYNHNNHVTALLLTPPYGAHTPSQATYQEFTTNLTATEHRIWFYLPEDFPVSPITGELYPTKNHQREVRTKNRHHELERFNNPTQCPSCGEPITTGQTTETFTHNLIVTQGPKVTFHTRKQCAEPLTKYREAHEEYVTFLDIIGQP